MKQALAGLEGVKVEDEWDRDPEAVELEDLLFVTYNPAEISETELVDRIKDNGFEPQIRQTDNPPGASK